MSHINNNYKKANEWYKKLKNESEKSVVRWQWATEDYYQLEPYYHERNFFSKGKLLNQKPRKKNYRYQYGFDLQNRVKVKRHWIVFNEKDYYEETFYIYKGNKVETFHYEYADEKKVTNVQMFMYNDKGKLSNSVFISQYREYEMTYFYIGDYLESVITSDIKTNEKTNQEHFIYDKQGTLEKIEVYDIESENFSYTRYKKKDEKRSIHDLLCAIQRELVKVIPQVIETEQLTEEVYTIMIEYGFGSDGFAIPTLAVGLESDRTYILEQYQDVSNGLIWSSGEFQTFVTIDEDLLENIKEEILMFDSYVNLHGKYSLVHKLMRGIARDLNNYQWNKTIKVAEDFVLFAMDHENYEYEKEMKQIVSSERIEKFKKKKWL